MSWFKFNGISSKDLGLIVTKIDPSPQTSFVYEEINIPNKLTPNLKPISYLKMVTFNPIEVVNIHDNLSDIYSVYTGFGNLITSLDETKYYKCWVSQLKPTKISRFYNQISIQIYGMPFAYDINNTPIILSQNDTITVNGSIYSEPKIKIYGNGNGILTVNGSELSVYIDEYLTVDTERLLVYKDNVVCLQQTVGTLPHFQVGENVISWSGGITSLEITKNERWL